MARPGPWTPSAGVVLAMRSRSRLRGLLCLTAIAFVPGQNGVAQAQSLTPFRPPPGAHYKPLCPAPDALGRRCYGHVLVDANEKPISNPFSPPGGCTPTELEAAYGLPAAGGNGKIIATF